MTAVPDPALESFVRSEVARQLGSRTRVVSLAVLATGVERTVLLLTLSPGDKVVMKLTAEPFDADVERTAAAVGLARAAAAPVGEVLAADGTRSRGPWSYLLQEHAEGVEWRRLRPVLQPAQVRAAHAQIAAAVLAMQRIRFPSFGELDHQGQPAGEDQLTALHAQARLSVADPDRRALLQEVLDREAPLFQAASTPTLVHDDLHHGNVIFSPDLEEPRLVSILDWDKAWAGPAESDVARLACWDDMTGPGFWQTYRAATPADEQTERRFLVHQLRWCLEYDVRTPRHLADTANLCRRLGIPPPAP